MVSAKMVPLTGFSRREAFISGFGGKIVSKWRVFKVEESKQSRVSHILVKASPGSIDRCFMVQRKRFSYPRISTECRASIPDRSPLSLRFAKLFCTPTSHPMIRHYSPIVAKSPPRKQAVLIFPSVLPTTGYLLTVSSLDALRTILGPSSTGFRFRGLSILSDRQRSVLSRFFAMLTYIRCHRLRASNSNVNCAFNTQKKFL